MNRFSGIPAGLRVAFVILAVLLAGLAALGDQGISTDEEDDLLAVVWNIRRLQTGEPIPNNVGYYGTLVPFSSEALFQVQSFLTHGTFRTRYFETNASTDDHESRLELRDRILLKHRLTFLISLAGYGAVAGLVGILAGAQYAWLGPLLLGLMPRYVGDSFFNPRDIPFAAMLTIGTLAGSRLLSSFFQASPADARTVFTRLAAYALLYGALVGLVTGTRLAGFLLLGFVFAAHVAVSLWNRNRPTSSLRFWFAYLLMALAWMAVVVLIHPASWPSPARWFIDAASFLSRYRWTGANLFNGTYIPGENAPWFYLPTWFAITTPELLQMLAAGGAVLLLIRFRHLSPAQQACCLLVAMQAAAIPAIAVLRGSTVYDALRQFLFVLPALATLGAVALAWLWTRSRHRLTRMSLVAGFILLASPILVDMVALHPYEFAYFNRGFGGLPAAYNRFDTEYSGLSMREGMEWINTNVGPGTRVVSSREMHSSETFALPTIQVISLREFDEQGGLTKPFYYIARPRFALQARFPECPVVFSVRRQDTPLTIIKRCD